MWNAVLPFDAALSPESARLSWALTSEARREIDRVDGRAGPWINTTEYSVPAYTAGPSVPRIRVALDVNVPELQRAWEAVPIPAGARPGGGSDANLSVYQPSSDTLWEFWLARNQADGWHARWGGRMTEVSRNPGYFPSPFGATASSLPLLAGLLTIDELRAGRIDHALAIAVPATADSFTWPAQRGDGRASGAEAIPEGTQFRIDPSVDLSQLGLSPVGLAIARAAQRYGMIVRDTSSCVTFYAEDPVTTSGNPYPELFGGASPDRVLAGFPWDRLQAIAPRDR